VPLAQRIQAFGALPQRGERDRRACIQPCSNGTGCGCSADRGSAAGAIGDAGSSCADCTRFRHAACDSEPENSNRKARRAGADSSGGGRRAGGGPLGPIRPMLPRRALMVLAQCRPDQERLCAGVPAGGGKIFACLAANAQQLSPICYDALARVSQ
jgi:hypothetical protein